MPTRWHADHRQRRAGIVTSGTMSTVDPCTVPFRCRTASGSLCERVIACRAPRTGQVECHASASRPLPILGLSYGYAPNRHRSALVRPGPFGPPRHRVCLPTGPVLRLRFGIGWLLHGGVPLHKQQEPAEAGADDTPHDGRADCCDQGSAGRRHDPCPGKAADPRRTHNGDAFTSIRESCETKAACRAAGSSSMALVER